jgi:hypothetical protein
MAIRNVDQMSQAEQMKLAIANQRIAAQQSAAYAKTAAAPIRAFGEAARDGGMFEDTSAAPGFQNRFTAQQTNQYMGQLTRPSLTALKGAKKFEKRMNMPYWEKLLQMFNKTRAGSGTSATGGTSGGGTPETETRPATFG